MKNKSMIPILTALFTAACASTPGQQVELNRLVTTIAPLVQSYAQTGKVSYAQAIPVALNSLAVLDPALPVNTTQLSTNITTAVSAFTNGTGGSTGQKIASAVLSALPINPTGAQANAALTAAGVGASDGAN